MLKIKLPVMQMTDEEAEQEDMGVKGVGRSLITPYTFYISECSIAPSIDYPGNTFLTHQGVAYLIKLPIDEVERMLDIERIKETLNFK